MLSFNFSCQKVPNILNGVKIRTAARPGSSSSSLMIKSMPHDGNAGFACCKYGVM